MSGYTLYPRFTDAFVSTVSRSVGLKGSRAERGQVAVRGFYEASGRFDVIETHLLADELGHAIDGGYVWFPESSDLIDSLHRSKFSISSEAFQLPHSSLTIAWPKGFSVRGVPVLPCLVSFRDYSLYRRNMLALVKEYPFMQDKLVPGSNGEPGKMLVISYPSRPGGVSYARVELDLPMIGQILSAGPESVPEVLGSQVFSLLLDPEDRKMAYLLYRLVCALCVYVQAVPEALVPGFPREVAPRAVSSDRYVPRVGFQVKSPTLNGRHASPESHYRTWHFRMLTSPKFTKKRFQLCFVRETLVNARDATPETIVSVEPEAVSVQV